ncbi:Protocadherin-like wing polarity protein stan [Dirofilaria immitis]
MGNKLIVIILCIFDLIYMGKCFAKVQCKYSEELIRLGRNENHSVPVCSSIASSRHDNRKSKQLEQNVIRCDGLICNRCRCNVKMGYKLSNNTDQAECVLICPKPRVF